MLVERLAHVNRDEKFPDLRRLAEERLAAVFEVRDKTYDTFRCQEVKGYYSTWVTGYRGRRYERREYGVVGIDLVKDQTKAFHLDVGELVRLLWLDGRSRAPAGQAVLLVGEASDRVEAGGWVWIRMAPDAIILCGTPTTSTAPIGRAAIGGLLVGTWRSSDAGPAPGDDAPGAAAVAPAAGAALAGPAPAVGPPIPVILAVMSAVGR